MLRHIAHRTPVLSSDSLDAVFGERPHCRGARLRFKCENLQRVGAFKFRGAYNAISRLSDDEKRRGVIAFSSGNHAQAVALASRMLGVSCTIVMPEHAPPAASEVNDLTADGQRLERKRDNVIGEHGTVRQHARAGVSFPVQETLPHRWGGPCAAGGRVGPESLRRTAQSRFASFSFSIALTTPGFALPWVAFITWPTK